MNQPASRCFGWVNDLVQIGELIEQRDEKKTKSPSPRAPAQPSGDWIMPDEMDGMEVDQPGDPHDGTVEEFPGAAAIFSHQPNSFLERFDRDQFSNQRQSNLYYPFASRADWEFGLWLTRSGLSMAAIDSLLSLQLVSLVILFDFPDWQQLKFLGESSPSFVQDGASLAWPD